MAYSHWSCASESISIAIIETIDWVEELLRLQGIFCERERLERDRQWLNRVLIEKPGIQYVRVVKVKPEGGIFIKQRYYFDAYIIKKNIPCCKKQVWWMYLVPQQR